MHVYIAENNRDKEKSYSYPSKFSYSSPHRKRSKTEKCREQNFPSADSKFWIGFNKSNHKFRTPLISKTHSFNFNGDGTKIPLGR